MVKDRVAVAARRVLGSLVAHVPPRHHVVVYGWPDHEGNSIEIVRTLLERYSGPVYLLLHEPRSAPEILGPSVDHPRLRMVHKTSARGLLAFLTAEMTFSTHGLYGTPRTGPGKITVNLWHGDGPKRTETAMVRTMRNYDLVVAGTALWGETKRKDFDLPEGSVILSGNPRIDQFQRPTTPQQLRRLGIGGDEKLVLWMPTYRAGRSAAGHAWQETGRLAEHGWLRTDMRNVAMIANEQGIKLIAKAHPLDVDRLEQLGIPCIRDEDLQRAETGTYQLLAASSALITDYSSVWTDYLSLNRPMGFYLPDDEAYQESRGLNVPDYRALLPGPVLRTVDDFADFFSQLRAGDAWANVRQRSIERIGAVTEGGASQRCLDLVDEWLVAQGQTERFRR